MQQTLRNRRPGPTIAASATTEITTDERAELARLRRENTRLPQEPDLLKRAAALFATENATR